MQIEVKELGGALADEVSKIGQGPRPCMSMGVCCSGSTLSGGLISMLISEGYYDMHTNSHANLESAVSVWLQAVIASHYEISPLQT